MSADTPAPRTLVPDLAARIELQLLPVRRLAHCVVASVMEGTRWALLEPAGDGLWQRLRGQVEAFLESFAQHGAIVGDRAEDSYFVICDQRLNSAPGELRVLFGFAPVRPAGFLSYLVTHRAAGSSVRAVSVSRVATHRSRGDEEVETAILQGLLT
jgi:phage tail sheath protein FI